MIDVAGRADGRRGGFWARRRLWAAVLILLAGTGGAGADTIWLEGEKPAQAAVSRHPWWYDQVKKDVLSEGDFISHFDDNKTGEVEYRFEAAGAGRHVFWLRANPLLAAMSYRLNGGEWKRIDLSKASDQVNIAADDKPDLRFIAWIDVGDVELRRGANTIALRMESEKHHHGIVDCLLFTTTGFIPKGKTRPGDPGAAEPAEPKTWAFQPPRDTYSAESLLDLRHLNEKEAGETGFVRVSKEGGDFVKGDGTELRLWPAHSSVWSHGDLEQLADHARFLAKRGVNIVRWHGNLAPKGQDSQLTDFDEQARDQLWKYVAAMKREGIYMTLSPYYAMPTKPQPKWGLPRGSKDMHALLFFDPDLQAAYKGWLRAALTPPNPYTGVPLKDEPAVAIIQLQNEDSLLFWTVANLKGGDLQIISRKYGEWLARRYGSIEKAAAAWKGEKAEGDDFAAGLAGFRHIWELTQPQEEGSGRAARLADQTRFWAETMLEFNAEIVRFLKDEVGVKQLINAGNWRTADPVRLNDLERWSYTATDVIAVNRYCGDTHLGEHNGWAIVNGDRFQNRSVLIRPEDFPVGLKQVAGRPIIITESNWVPPLGYQSEGPFLVAAYASLTGVDGMYWFNMSQPQWRQPSSANGFLPSIGKWVADTPEILGNFPAAALMYRQGYVKLGQVVVHEQRSLDDLWHRRVPIISEEGAYDPNRDPTAYAPKSSIKQEVDRLAFLVGPVEVTYDADPAGSRVTDLKPFIDTQKQKVQSITGELEWDYGRGICTLNAPKAQGVTGFIGQVGRFELGTVTMESGNDYATVLAVAMDDKPLDASGRILVQVGTVARPTRWKQREITWQDDQKQERKGFEVVNYGEAPWRIVEHDVQVTVANRGLTKAIVLDMNGMATGEIDLRRSGGKASVRLPKDAKYVILQ